MSQSAYSHFRQGSELLGAASPHAAVVPLERARSLEPGKGSIREALGRAYFGAGRYPAARDEFAAALELDPTNHYAHFGLALSLERLGHLDRARGHAKLAFAMAPDVEHYRRVLSRLSPAS